MNGKGNCHWTRRSGRRHPDQEKKIEKLKVWSLTHLPVGKTLFPIRILLRPPNYGFHIQHPQNWIPSYRKDSPVFVLVFEGGRAGGQVFVAKVKGWKGWNLLLFPLNPWQWFLSDCERSKGLYWGNGGSWVGLLKICLTVFWWALSRSVGASHLFVRWPREEAQIELKRDPSLFLESSGPLSRTSRPLPLTSWIRA